MKMCLGENHFLWHLGSKSKDKYIHPMVKTTSCGTLDKYHDENLVNMHHA